jgi:hypothetical protein
MNNYKVRHRSGAFSRSRPPPRRSDRIGRHYRRAGGKGSDHDHTDLFASDGDLVKLGLVAGLNRPGADITGRVVHRRNGTRLYAAQPGNFGAAPDNVSPLTRCNLAVRVRAMILFAIDRWCGLSGPDRVEADLLPANSSFRGNRK